MQKTVTRRARAAAGVAALLTMGALSACGAPGGQSDGATDYPTKTIDVIVPYPAGGGSDVIARALVDEVNAQGELGADLQVINKDGGAGTVGFTEMINAEADGYTLAISPPGPVWMNPVLTDVAYDPTEDINFIAGVTTGGSLIAVPAASPYQTFDDLIAAAKANPGAITMGGGPPAYEIPLALLEQAADVTFQHVEFEGDAATTTALLGNNIDATATQAAAAIPQVQAGTIRVLATFGAERSPLLPDVPTTTELGYDVAMDTGYAVYGQAGMSAEITDEIAGAIEKALTSPALQDKGAQVGIAWSFTNGVDQRKHDLDGLQVVQDLKDSGAL